ncbi:chorismate mutase [Sphingomonas sp.]|uniref:chorismate mutase n=1 Tax=Sphingomonas sp. TaxID=28214 RepID=UPI002E35A15E|nr:chorismate mutase [Sphingomonas sp.]HEX4693301.1 chorismate mutase [Sphingomonas sp.]
MIAPEDCETMAEVRAGVDSVDLEIVALLAVRFRLMTAAARIKQDRGTVRDEGRKALVIANAKVAAARAGVPPELVGELWERLVEGSIAYEFDRWDDHRA